MPLACKMSVELTCFAEGQHSCLAGVQSDRPPQSDSPKNTFETLGPFLWQSPVQVSHSNPGALSARIASQLWRTALL